jgi:hypothetical protein
MCCQIRTMVLFIGFFMGFMEVTLWVVYYTWRLEWRLAAGFEDGEADFDLIICTIIIFIDLIVNILLISGANKDYSGRRKDLRKGPFLLMDFLCSPLQLLVLLFLGQRLQ